MTKKNGYYIQIQKWEKGVLVVERIGKQFDSLSSARVAAAEHSARLRNAPHKIKIYDYLDELVHSHEVSPKPSRVPYV